MVVNLSVLEEGFAQVYCVEANEEIMNSACGERRFSEVIR